MPNPTPRYLRRRAVTETYGIGRSTIYDHVRDGLLPPAAPLGPRAAGWPVEELEAIFRARAAGANDAAVRRLVRELVAARQQPASAA